MTLAEVAEFVCDRIGQSDAASLEICKKFAKRRYQMIWDAEPWRETNVLWTQSVAAGSSEIIAPAGVERFMRARWDTSSTLDYTAPENLFDLDPEIFERTGTPTRFHELPPVITSSLQSFAGVSGWGASTTSAQDIGMDAVLIYERSDNIVYRETITLALSPIFSSAGSPTATALRGFSKPVTTGSVLLESNSGLLIVLNPGDRQAPLFARIKLRETPADAKTLLCLGKRRFVPLDDDADAPLLPSIDNAWASFVSADMLKRQRQYAKSSEELKDAAAQMVILRDLQRNQQAQTLRFVPAPEPDAWEYGTSFSDKSHW